MHGRLGASAILNRHKQRLGRWLLSVIRAYDAILRSGFRGVKG
jgi:hypothetical protein